MKRKLTTVVGSLLFVALLTMGVLHRQWLKDYYIVRTTNLTPSSAHLKDSLQLTSEASFIYEASRPLIQPAQEFNLSCQNAAHEHSIVLGCYTNQRFFVFDVQDPRLKGAKEVTAAHELLHAIYERLPADERTKLNNQLVATANTINDLRFKDTLAEYRRTEPEHIENELHSILGTEIAVLPQSLEAHYRQYFTDRSRIVSLARQYESSFTALDDQIKHYDNQLNQLKNQKETIEANLETLQDSIEADRSQLNAYQAADDTAAYNQAVPAYNDQIRRYNSLINQLRQTIAEYNKLVEDRNRLAATQNDLVKQLDSKYQPLQ